MFCLQKVTLRLYTSNRSTSNEPIGLCSRTRASTTITHTHTHTHTNTYTVNSHTDTGTQFVIFVIHIHTYTPRKLIYFMKYLFLFVLNLSSFLNKFYIYILILKIRFVYYVPCSPTPTEPWLTVASGNQGESRDVTHCFSSLKSLCI